MKKLFAVAALAFFAVLPFAPAQETPAAQPATADQAKPAEHGTAAKEADKDAAIPPEKAVTTHHELAIGGKTLK